MPCLLLENVDDWGGCGAGPWSLIPSAAVGGMWRGMWGERAEPFFGAFCHLSMIHVDPIVLRRGVADWSARSFIRGMRLVHR